MILTVRDLSFSYGGTSVLRDVSFSMDAGEIVCVVGPNGSGKTTLLDCVSGFLRPQAGEVLVEDKPLREYGNRALAQKIACVPQVHHPTFPYRVRDVVLMGRTAHVGAFGAFSAQDHAACDEAMRAVGIESFADRVYSTLSGGELRLVLLARALAQKPRLVVLDEPTVSLDFQNELRFLETLTDLVKTQRISALFATHALSHAFFFERVGVPVRTALLCRGRPMRLGSPQQILTKETLSESFGVSAKITETVADGETIRQITLLHTIRQEDDPSC